MSDIALQFVAESTFAGKPVDYKLKFILDAVRKGRILVLERGLTVEEERDLIKATMPLVSKGFAGIEVSTLSQPGKDIKSSLIKFLGGSQGLTVVGPSNLVKQIKKDPRNISVLAGK